MARRHGERLKEPLNPFGSGSARVSSGISWIVHISGFVVLETGLIVRGRNRTFDHAPVRLESAVARPSAACSPNHVVRDLTSHPPTSSEASLPCMSAMHPSKGAG